MGKNHEIVHRGELQQIHDDPQWMVPHRKHVILIFGREFS
jgi:hypothetical protein